MDEYSEMPKSQSFREASASVREALAKAEPRLGESRWRSTDHALADLQAIAEKHIDQTRLWRNRAISLQREMVSRVGACPVKGCVRHLDHLGPCPVEAEEFDG